MSNTKFDVRDFRSALGHFPTGVTVITALDKKGEPIGCTASSFNSVSMEPALVLWSVDKNAFSATIFEQADYFAINVLSENQVATSNRFAGRGEDKFKDVSYSSGLGGIPLLEGCGAQFECKTWNVYEGGDHLIIVGEVINYSHDDSTMPLVFSSGSYAITAQHPNSGAENKLNSSNSEFLNDYLLYLLNASISQYRKELYPMLIDGCNVTPEHWRILTILTGSSTLGFDDLGERVMQPSNDLKQSLELLNEQKVVQCIDNKISLTAKGEELQTRLFAIAKQHEATLLSKLSPEEISTFKKGLKCIVGMQ
ncbi:MAG: flavin reductase (DIM6/NTAB) family NADH-FMN oxidoreductase RutF [Paraglaciecola sp.]|jgi:flavin reductase (DIM6/NTAB) family NADH-FMN oxidoreductase RutF/DNA-binding MarR family transcriptional regulator